MLGELASLASSAEADWALEAACCKVFASEMLWRAADEMVQLGGGRGFVKPYPYERMLRDSRINRIFEGTNEILRLFIALNGIQGPAEQLKEIGSALRRPLRNLGLISGFAASRLRSALGATPTLDVDAARAARRRTSSYLEKHVAELSIGDAATHSALPRARSSTGSRSWSGWPTWRSSCSPRRARSRERSADRRARRRAVRARARSVRSVRRRVRAPLSRGARAAAVAAGRDAAAGGAARSERCRLRRDGRDSRRRASSGTSRERRRTTTAERHARHAEHLRHLASDRRTAAWSIRAIRRSRITPQQAIAKGAGANVSSLSFGSHTGTHVDAPKHFFDDGVGVDALALDVLMGPAVLIDVGDDVHGGRREGAPACTSSRATRAC